MVAVHEELGGQKPNLKRIVDDRTHLLRSCDHPGMIHTFQLSTCNCPVTRRKVN